MKANTDRTVKFNKRFTKIIRLLGSARTALRDRCVILAAWLLGLLPWKGQPIPVLQLPAYDRAEVLINCLGSTDLQGKPDGYARDLQNIRDILQEADLSLTSVRGPEQSRRPDETLTVLLERFGIRDVAGDNRYIRSRIYQTGVGKVAVTSYMQRFAATGRRNRLALAEEYLALKKMGADYVIFYIDGNNVQHISEADRKLHRFLLKLGVDYIVGIKPDICSGGTTFRQKNGSVSHSIYSLGTFLSDGQERQTARAVLRLRLRKENGKLQACQETFYPLRWDACSGMKNLIVPDAERNAEDTKALADLERSFSGIRPADRMLTVGRILQIIDAKLPQEYAHLWEHSVGKVCARSFEVNPGDVFFFREPFQDPNDQETVDPAKRLKLAKKAARRGAILLVTFREHPFACCSVVCDNVMEAHIAVCAHLRQQLDMRVVGITGSIGKTSTKDMLAEVMKMRYNTVKSKQNTNVQVKIGMNLQQLRRDCQVMIQEIGGGRPGGASRHARMVLPEATVVTNIGDAHIGNFLGDKNALMRNKLGIIDGMTKDGTVFLNGDDPLLKDVQPDCSRVLFAIHNKNADYYADDLVETDGGIEFDIVYGDERIHACVNVPGEHNVLNAVCSFAIGRQFGIPEADIVRGIANFRTQGIRQNIVVASGRKLFFDCFNASSGSVESSIRTLGKIRIPENARRIAVLGDITGLGDLAEQTHREMAQVLMAHPADLFLLYGANTRFTYEILKANGFAAHYTADYSELTAWLTEMSAPGDAIMAKGSSKMMLEYAFDCAFGTCTFDTAMIEEGTYSRVKLPEASYNLFRSHATLVRPGANKAHIRAREKVGSVPVCSVAAGFASGSMVSAELPDTVRHIGENAFRDCGKLQTVTGIMGLKYIGDGAFAGCTELQTLGLPDTLLHIGGGAFAGCTSLKELHIPKSVAYIGDGAFADCPGLKFRCEKGSTAEAWLRDHGMPYSCQGC